MPLILGHILQSMHFFMAGWKTVLVSRRGAVVQVGPQWGGWSTDPSYRYPMDASSREGRKKMVRFQSWDEL
jgi:hypothetical protein